MSVKINIHHSFSRFTNGQTAVEVNGNTVGQCLDELVKRFPQLKKKLFEKNGALSRIVDIYLNGESAYPEGLEAPVKDGDELHIVIIISGG